jgi:diaminopimelate epimerase
VGADGVLVVGSAGPDRVRVRFFNPDGSGAFCGNGSRCAARFAHERGMVGESFVLETRAGDVPAHVTGDRVRLRLPTPVDAGPAVLRFADERLEGRSIHAGTPHFVVFVDDPRTARLEHWGPLVRRHAYFAPEGVNLDLARCDGSLVELRTWERGVERETLACGSGAVAAAAAARIMEATDRFTIVPASGIPLEVAFVEADRVELAGDARIVFETRLGPEAVEGF